MRFKHHPADTAYIIFIYIFVGLLGIIALYPFLYVISVSISNPLRFVREGLWLFPKGFELNSYKIVLSNQRVLTSYWNSTIYAVGSTFMIVMGTLLTAYPLSKKQLFGKKIIWIYFIIPMYFGGGMIPTYLLMLKLGLYNNRFAMIVPGFLIMFYVIITISYIRETIPNELEECARLDGANDIRILFQIIMPLIKPVLAVVILYQSVAMWNVFLSAVIYLQDRKLQPIQVYLAQVIIQNEGMRGFEELSLDNVKQVAISSQLKYTLIVVAIFPIMMVYPFIQKYIVQGILVGSIKG